MPALKRKQGTEGALKKKFDFVGSVGKFENYHSSLRYSVGLLE